MQLKPYKSDTYNDRTYMNSKHIEGVLFVYYDYKRILAKLCEKNDKLKSKIDLKQIPKSLKVKDDDSISGSGVSDIYVASTTLLNHLVLEQATVEKLIEEYKKRIRSIEVTHKLNRRFSNLSEDEKKLIEAYYSQGKTLEQIASERKQTKANIQHKLNYIKEKLTREEKDVWELLN